MNGLAQGTDAWLAARNTGIGGSEVAALYPKEGTKTGTFHPYLSQYQLWAIKTGRATSDVADPIERPELWWGKELEPIVKRAYTLITGRTVVDGVTMLRHPSVACMLANTDGRIVGVQDKPGDGNYEGKTTTIYKRDEWEHGPPLYIQAQTQHYLACTGLQWSSVVLYMAGNRQPIQYEDIGRNERFIDDLCERAEKWWDRHVVRDTPPEIDGSDRTTSLIASMFADTEPGRVVELDEEWAAAVAEMDAIDPQIKALKTKKNLLRNRLRAVIGTAEYGRLPDGSGWSCKLQKRKGYTKVIQPFEGRVLKRVKKVSP